MVKTNTNKEYPIKGMLAKFGLNTTGKIGWALMYGGNGNGVELRADGKYYHINRGNTALGAYVFALAGEKYHSLDFGDLDPIEIIADKEEISYEKAKKKL